MSTENKRISREFIEAFNRNDFDAMVEFLADNYVYHGPTGDVSGPNGFRQLAQMYRTGFPDVVMSIDDQIAEGDKVVTRATARGRHLGDFAGLAPTGKAVAVPLILIDRIEDGRIAESWEAFDQLGMLQSLGAIPAAV